MSTVKLYIVMTFTIGRKLFWGGGAKTSLWEGLTYHRPLLAYSIGSDYKIYGG